MNGSNVNNPTHDIVRKHFQRNEAGVNGAVSYTGYGFTPGMVIIICSVGSGRSIGAADSLGNYSAVLYSVGAGVLYNGNQLVYGQDAAGNGQSAVLTSLDADGFTLTWTKIGAGVDNLECEVLAFR